MASHLSTEQPMNLDDTILDAFMCNSQLYAHINNNDCDALRDHLMKTRESLDVTTLVNSNGYSPIHLASSKSQIRNCEILIDFVLN